MSNIEPFKDLEQDVKKIPIEFAIQERNLGRKDAFIPVFVWLQWYGRVAVDVHMYMGGGFTL